jgi:hypothetical protein
MQVLNQKWTPQRSMPDINRFKTRPMENDCGTALIHCDNSGGEKYSVIDAP